MSAPAIKVCARCGSGFRRPSGSGRISDDRWTQRQYCSSDCGIEAYSPKLTLGVPSTFDAARVNAETSSKMLLTRQMGLYSRVARERGLNDIWEAAVVLGMAA